MKHFSFILFMCFGFLWVQAKSKIKENPKYPELVYSKHFDIDLGTQEFEEYQSIDLQLYEEQGPIDYILPNSPINPDDPDTPIDKDLFIMIVCAAIYGYILKIKSLSRKTVLKF